MVTCRCGASFENYYGDAVAICPSCNRVYLNMSPDMYHPQTVEEMAWTCPSCKQQVPATRGGLFTEKCIYCGTAKP